METNVSHLYSSAVEILHQLVEISKRMIHSFLIWVKNNPEKASKLCVGLILAIKSGNWLSLLGIGYEILALI